MFRCYRVLVVVALLAGCSSTVATEAQRLSDEPPSLVVTSVPVPTIVVPTLAPVITAVPTVVESPVEPTAPGRAGVDSYRGLGAWVDVFDWAPAYAGSDGPSVTPDGLGEMAAMGVSTLYLQTSRIDDVGSGSIQNPTLIASLLERAHTLDMTVVGWFLPKWEDAAEDLVRLTAIADFDVDGQQFDGVAVDIEGLPTPGQRQDWNVRLVQLSEQLRAHVGDQALGAIVLPPTVLEVVNPEYWPDFPWAELAPLYDVWMPMSYWSFRDDDSPFAGGYAYNADATQRLRTNLGDASALVHAIGGIGAVVTDPNTAEPLASVDELDDFVRSAVDTAAIGISIYDWESQDVTGRQTMSELFEASQLADG